MIPDKLNETRFEKSVKKLVLDKLLQCTKDIAHRLINLNRQYCATVIESFQV